jgi:hypothetical protein
MSEQNRKTKQDAIVRPRISQRELFIIVNLLNDQCANRKAVQSQTPYSKQLRRLRRKLRRNLKIDHADFKVVSNRVPYVKAEQREAKAETGEESLREKAIKKRTIAPERERFFAFSY